MGIPTDVSADSETPYTVPQNRLAWVICCTLTALTFLVYLATSIGIGQGDVIMPLDDTYIHFQYARQLANGEPYVYNPGDPPTSGATSFVYPYMLAVGYVLGFKGLTLGVWAMSVGALALLTAAWAVYLLIRVVDAPFWIALLFASAFILTGAFAWHFMSGMETGIVTALTLATLSMLITRHFRGLMITAALLAISRPEGSIMAVIVVVAVLLQYRFSVGTWHTMSLRPHRMSWLALPVLAVALQPTVNLLLTGSPSSTGGQAKSIFGMIPFYWDVVIRRIWQNFSHMWVEFATGTDGYYLPVIIPPFAWIGLIFLLTRSTHRLTGLVVIGWLLVVSGAIATLDTAFWHFKRYQMPLMALFFPLAGWGINAIFLWLCRQLEIESTRTDRDAEFLDKTMRRIQTAVALLLVIFLLLPTLLTTAEFLRLYDVNLRNIMAQPYPMARWLAENTPEDAVVAVHDVGMMRYVGNRYTVDMVGLTTPSAADAWRNGPGAVAEFIMSHNPHPVYVAAYTTARGLNYLADTSIYGELLAGFSAEYDPADNVALAAEFQGIYRVNEMFIDVAESRAMQGSVMQYLNRPAVAPAFVVDQIDVADVVSEEQHEYSWTNREPLPGFSSEVYQFGYISCGTDASEGGCNVLDGGRRITGEEQFVVVPEFPGDAVLLVTRVHPAIRTAFDVYVNDIWIDRQWIPENPGHWLEIATYIPHDYVTEHLNIRVVPDSGIYMPYLHWVYQGLDDLYRPWMQDPVLVMYQDGAVSLMSIDQSYEYPDYTRNNVRLIWQTDGRAEGDYVMFFHVYDDLNQPPIWQMDRLPGDGTMPLGNVLPGTFSDHVEVDVSGLAPGTYQAAIGFYDPLTLDRLVPSYDRPNDGIFVDEHNRILFYLEVRDE